MTYKTVMVALALGQSNDGRVEVAAQLAEQFGARVIGAAAAEFSPPLYFTEGEPAQRLIDQGWAAVKDRLKELESEFRAAIERDQTGTEVYVDLAQFYAEHKRFAEVGSVLKDAEQHAIEKDDLFANLISRYWFIDNIEIPEGLAASQPQRMAQSFGANLNLARIRIDNDRPREALPLLKKAAALDSKSSDPYDWMAEAYRKLREWPAALNAADTAVRLDNEDADGYYHRACALARAGAVQFAP